MLPEIKWRKIPGATEYVPFRIEYENEAGYDSGFCEWWNVTNDKMTFRCDSEDDAEWLMNELNREI